MLGAWVWYFEQVYAISKIGNNRDSALWDILISEHPGPMGIQMGNFGIKYSTGYPFEYWVCSARSRNWQYLANDDARFGRATLRGRYGSDHDDLFAPTLCAKCTPQHLGAAQKVPFLVYGCLVQVVALPRTLSTPHVAATSSSSTTQ